MTYPLPATFPFPPPPPPHPPFPAPLPVIHLNNNLNFETFRTRQRITKQGYGTHITTANSLNKSNLTLTLISTYTEYPKILPRISHANTGVRLSGCSWRTQSQLHLYTKYCINIKSSLRTKNDSKTRRPAKIGQINLELKIPRLIFKVGGSTTWRNCSCKEWWAVSCDSRVAHASYGMTRVKK